MAELLFNLIQSTNPCPDCESASSAESMTLANWGNSSFGVPGGGGRVCGGNCHCLLIPDGTELPILGDEKLRGDKDTDIQKITQPFPLELRFEELSLQWRERFGNMPGRFLRMDLETLIRTLERELGIA